MQALRESGGLKVLFIEEGDGRWSAQCLDYDVVAQASKFSDLQYELEKTLTAYLMISEAEGVDVFGELGPAPRKFWDMWESDEASERQFSLERATYQPERPISIHLPKRHVRIAGALPA